MASKTMLILYYSGTGNTERMAKAIAEGARSASLSVLIERADKFEALLLPQ